MRRLLLCLVITTFFVPTAFADDKDKERLNKAADVLSEIFNVPDNVPQDLIDKATCVIVMPSVKKFALGLGGSYGKGFMTCRGGKEFTGRWGAPAAMRLEGASIGFQLGGSATDFVLLVMNDKGASKILSSKAKLGVDASAAAGPKGRTAEGATDLQMSAEILTYSRAKGLFAGVSLEGSTLRQDHDANKEIYGRDLEAKDIVLNGAVAPTSGGYAMISVLSKKSPTLKTDKK
jgi:SH3 domain-containing YSC84-like protein 1